MAKIGLTNFRYGILTEAQDGTPSYGGAKTSAKAISCNVEISNNDAKLFADDTVQETDTSFSGGTATIGVDRYDYQMQADLLGHTYDSETQNLIRNTNDVAPYVGFGRVITEMVDGAYQYRVEFLYKVKFAEPSQEDNTKGESVEFGTFEMEGTVARCGNGLWSVSQVFSTKEAAITYLEGLLTASTASTTDGE